MALWGLYIYMLYFLSFFLLPLFTQRFGYVDMEDVLGI